MAMSRMEPRCVTGGGSAKQSGTERGAALVIPGFSTKACLG